PTISVSLVRIDLSILDASRRSLARPASGCPSCVYGGLGTTQALTPTSASINRYTRRTQYPEGLNTRYILQPGSPQRRPGGALKWRARFCGLAAAPSR